MIWRHERARHYIEADVEWWTLLFFMMLFAVAGTLEHTHVTEEVANRFQNVFGNQTSVLTPVIIAISAIGSAFVDNIVFVAAFMPVVNKLEQTPLLWALLQGACLGGKYHDDWLNGKHCGTGDAGKKVSHTNILFTMAQSRRGCRINLVPGSLGWHRCALAIYADKSRTNEYHILFAYEDSSGE